MLHKLIMCEVAARYELLRSVLLESGCIVQWVIRHPLKRTQTLILVSTALLSLAEKLSINWISNFAFLLVVLHCIQVIVILFCRHILLILNSILILLLAWQVALVVIVPLERDLIRQLYRWHPFMILKRTTANNRHTFFNLLVVVFFSEVVLNQYF